MSSDYPAALSMLVPDQYVFLGSEGHTRRYLIVHKTAGFESAEEVARFFQAGAPQPDGSLAETSVHYVIGQDGLVVQCVREADGAGGNGILEAGHDPWWSAALNPNLITFSIEHVDPATDNSTPLTEAQQAASFALIRSICTRWNIPMRAADASGGITGHYSIDPVTRKQCPGTYPWAELWSYLKGAPMSEVCSMVDDSQFAGGHSQDKCGFYSVALCKYAGKAGAAPTGTPLDVTRWADSEYIKYDGPDVASNFNGMVMQTLFDVLHDAGLHYQVVASGELGYHTERMTAAYIRAWLKLRYPVVLAVAESAVYDDDLQGSPYSWDTSGLYHIIVATGFDGTAMLCHDTASIDASGVRPGPRRYDAARLQGGLTSATAVVLPWLTRPQGDYDPIASGGIMPPTGWKDDGKTLTAPNGIVVKAGFRDYVLNYTGGWEPGNWPLEAEQTLSMVELANKSGTGSRQIFRSTMLCWYAGRGVVQALIGHELYAWITQSEAQHQQIVALEAQLKAVQTPIVPAKIDVPGAVAALAALTKDAAALKSALGVQ